MKSLESFVDKNCGVAPILCQLIVAENNFPEAICASRVACRIREMVTKPFELLISQ